MAKKFDYLGEWKEIVAEFQTGTGKTEPAQTTRVFLTKYKDIEVTLKSATDTCAAVNAGKGMTKDNVAAFDKAVKDFDKSQKRYVKDLESAIKADKKLNPGQKTDYQKWLKVLLKNCDALAASMKSFSASAHQSLKQATAFELTAKTLVKTMHAACKRAEALIAHVKANPTAKTFNDGILTAARDINQPMGNIKNLRERGFSFPKKMTNDQADTLFKVLRPWAGGQRSLDPAASKQDVLRELDAFRQMVKAAEKWCGM